MNCGREAFFGKRSRLTVDVRDKFAPYEKIILVSPVWAGRTVPAINTVLHLADLSGREVTLFACQADPELTALKKIKARFKKILAEKSAKYSKCYCVQGSRPRARTVYLQKIRWIPIGFTQRPVHMKNNLLTPVKWQ